MEQNNNDLLMVSLEINPLALVLTVFATNQRYRVPLPVEEAQKLALALLRQPEVGGEPAAGLIQSYLEEKAAALMQKTKAAARKEICH